MKKMIQGILFTQLVFIGSAICMTNNENKDSNLKTENYFLTASLGPLNSDTVSDDNKKIDTQDNSNVKNKLFLCETCGRDFKTHGNRYQHEKYAHVEGRLTCQKCRKSYDSGSTFIHHACGFQKDNNSPGYKYFERIAAGPECRSFRCIHCNQPYVRKNGRDNHQASCTGKLNGGIKRKIDDVNNASEIDPPNKNIRSTPIQMQKKSNNERKINTTINALIDLTASEQLLKKCLELLTEKKVLLKSNDSESKNNVSNELDYETIEEEVLALEEYVGGFEQNIKWIKELNDELKELEKNKCDIDKFVKEYDITELKNTRETIDSLCYETMLLEKTLLTFVPLTKYKSIK